VLVSVVIMAFVIVIAVFAMQSVTESQCKAEMKRAASDLKTQIQNVVKGNDTTLSFTPPVCFRNTDETIQLKVLNSEPLCNFYCGGTKRECLVFYYEPEGHDTEILCLESASIQTQFLTGSDCTDRDGYDPVDFKSAVVRGNYVLENKSSSDSSFPKICAYRKVAG
jgi:type II secretory pathway pseudopilin PulG